VVVDGKDMVDHIEAVYPLASVKEALAHVQRGGKVLLDIGSR
jgi:hypothetical protein